MLKMQKYDADWHGKGAEGNAGHATSVRAFISSLEHDVATSSVRG